MISGMEEILARGEGPRVGVVLPKLGTMLLALRDLLWPPST